MAANTTNVPITPGAGVNVETENVPQPGSVSGDRQRMQIAGRAGSSTDEASNDVAVVIAADDLSGSTKFGLAVRHVGRTAPAFCNAALAASTVSVGSTATQLPASPLSNRRTLIIKNEDASNTVKIGGSAVTNSGAGTDGVSLEAGQSMTLAVGPGALVYGICASGQTANVSCLELAE